MKITHRLTGAVLYEGDLATMAGASLRCASLSGANLSGANLTVASLRGANLSGANLTGANLRDANLIGANLRGANLSGANLTVASLRGANLIGANLSGASLRGANLIGANLSGASLSGANLRCANLTGASLRCANLRDADLNWQSHALLAEVLRQAAGDDASDDITCQRRAFAGLVSVSTDWCWDTWLSMRERYPDVMTWAGEVLAAYVREGDGSPAALRAHVTAGTS